MVLLQYTKNHHPLYYARALDLDRSRIRKVQREVLYLLLLQQRAERRSKLTVFSSGGRGRELAASLRERAQGRASESEDACSLFEG